MNNAPLDPEAVIFNQARQLPAGQRDAFLSSACGNDAALRRRIEELLRFDVGGDFLQNPAPDVERPVGLQTTIVIPPAEQPGDRIGRYKLLQQIGEGGCGTVFMAEQTEPVRRQVALKIVKLGMDTRSVVARFEAERQALALMDHPNIAKVLDAGATQTGRPYFVMELVRGAKITNYCDHEKLSTEERLELFIQVCHAIQHAHQKGIIHRDLKPSNILVTLRDGVPVPKVIDFGIAKATTDQRLTDKTLFTAFEQFIGTPAYMSPEQAEMSELGIDTRTDIYSLGILLYELLTGKTPFDARELMAAGLDAMRQTIRQREPIRPSTRLRTMVEGELTTTASQRHIDAPKLIHLIRGDLDWIAMKCLEKDRTRRYDTANSLALDIERHLHNEPVTAVAPSAGYRLRKFVRRHRLGVLAGSLVMLALLAGMVGTTLGLMEALRQKREALRQGSIARHSSEFLTGMFESIDPAQARLREITVREILDDAAGKLDSAFPNEPLIELPIRETMADIYGKLGRDDKALANAESAYRLAKAAHGEKDHRDVAQSLVDVADRLDADGRVTEAFPRAQEALAMWQRLNHGDNAATAAAFVCVGSRLANLERGDEALTNFEAALAMWRRLTNKDDIHIAQTLDSEALALDALERAPEALPKHEEALAVWRRIKPGDDPNVAHNIGGLALCLDTLGRPAEALPLHEEALAMQRRIFRADHQEIARNINNVAVCLGRLGRLPEALTNYQTALEMCQRLYHGDHPDVAVCFDNVAQCLESMDRPAEALPNHLAALAMAQRVYKGDQPEVAKDLNNLAIGLSRLERFSEALTNFNASSDMCRRLFHGDHPHLALVLNHTADTLAALGRSDDALAKYEEAIAMNQRLAVAQPHNAELPLGAAVCFGRMGDLQAQLGRPQAAQESYQNGLRITDAILAANADHPAAAKMRARFRQKLALDK